MPKDTLLPNGLVVKAESRNTEHFSLEKFLRDTFTKRLHVPFYDACCPATSVQYPVAYSSVTGLLGRYDPVTKVFIPVTGVATGGAPGSVTQITSNVTDVTNNAAKGKITTVSLTTAPDTSFTFTLFNSNITATSVITLTVQSITSGVPHVTLGSAAGGAINIKVTNVGTVAFDSALIIHYVIQ